MNPKTLRILTGIYLLLIIAISSIPADSFPESKLFSFDKIIHMIEYGILGWLIHQAFGPTKTSVKIFILFIIMFGAFDELWQFMIPGRMTSLYDWLADIAGGILGIYLYSFRKRSID